MRASRLLSILILLQTRGRLSAEFLAKEFEISVRTIYRDIDQLSAAGVPVYAERGRNGGFALLDGYRTRLTGLSAAEAEALLLSGAGRAADALGVGAHAAAAQLKMLASLPPDAAIRAQRIGERFHLDTALWYAREESLDLLPALASAVWDDRRIRIDYESWKAPVARLLDPLGLVLKAGVWYLVAAARGAPRTYRVSSIRTLDLTDEPSRRPANFDLARYWQSWSEAFEARLLRERAVVRLSPEGRRRLREVSPAAADAVDAKHTRCAPKGWVKADIPVEPAAYTARLLLQLGPEIEVLSPPELRAAIAAQAQTIAALYVSRR